MKKIILAIVVIFIITNCDSCDTSELDAEQDAALEMVQKYPCGTNTMVEIMAMSFLLVKANGVFIEPHGWMILRDPVLARRYCTNLTNCYKVYFEYIEGNTTKKPIWAVDMITRKIYPTNQLAQDWLKACD